MKILNKNIIDFLETLLEDLEERRYDRCMGMIEGAISIFEILEDKKEGEKE